jgi:hypothetical protein
MSDDHLARPAPPAPSGGFIARGHTLPGVFMSDYGPNRVVPLGAVEQSHDVPARRPGAEEPADIILSDGTDDSDDHHLLRTGASEMPFGRPAAQPTQAAGCGTPGRVHRESDRETGDQCAPSRHRQNIPMTTAMTRFIAARSGILYRSSQECTRR